MSRTNSNVLYVLRAEILPIKKTPISAAALSEDQFKRTPFEISIKDLVKDVKIYDMQGVCDPDYYYRQKRKKRNFST